MKKDTDERILNELQNINKSLKEMNDREDPKSELAGMVRAIMLGFLIVGPGIAIGYGILQFVSSLIID